MSFNDWSKKRRKIRTSNKKRKINNENTIIIH